MPANPRLRAERKADLLLASELLREQSVLAFDDIGQRADGLARRVLVVRDWLSSPVVLAAASTGAAFFAASGRSGRGRLWRGLRWAWLAWRMWSGRRR